MQPSQYVVDLTNHWFDELVWPGVVKAAEIAEGCGEPLVGSVV